MLGTRQLGNFSIKKLLVPNILDLVSSSINLFQSIIILKPFIDYFSCHFFPLPLHPPLFVVAFEGIEVGQGGGERGG